jgi:hypothetical protein
MVEAVLIFADRDEARAATADLIEHDCTVEELDLVDDYGPLVWLRITVATELKPDGGFSAWMNSIIDPHRGFLDVWDFAENRPYEDAYREDGEPAGRMTPRHQ